MEIPNSRLLAVMIGDAHLGHTWGAHSVSQTRQQLKNAYFDAVREAGVKYGRKLISVGDFFDKTHNDETTIFRAITQADDYFLAILAGNHDIENKKGSLSSFQFMDLTIEDNPIHMSYAENLSEPFFSEFTLCPEVCVIMVPHHLSQELFEKALEAAAKRAAQLKPTKAILVAHCNYGESGGKSDSDLYLTPKLQASMEEFFDLIFLGHEHLPAQIGRTYITGSCQPCNFGELGPRFFWEVHLDVKSEALKVIKSPITSVLRHVVFDCTNSREFDFDYAPGDPQLVKLEGSVPLEKAAQVHALVKRLYGAGALAVKVDIDFQSGAGEGLQKVDGKMSNLLDTVRSEIELAGWADLFEEAVLAVRGADDV